MKIITLRVDDFGRAGHGINVIGECWVGGCVKLIDRSSGRTYNGKCIARRTIADQPATRQPSNGFSRKTEYDFELSHDAPCHTV